MATRYSSSFTSLGTPTIMALPPSLASLPGLALDVAHDVLDAGVVLEPVDRKVLSVARALEAAMRHLRDERDVGVDPHAAVVEVARHAHRPAVVSGPHRRRQPVLHAVGPFERLGLVAELLDGDHGAEDLVLHHLVVLAEPGHDGRREAVAALAHLRAAGDGLRMRRCALEKAAYALELCLIVERSVVGVLVVGPADGGAFRLFDQRCQQLTVDAGTGEGPGGRSAVLAGIEVARTGDALGGCRGIGRGGEKEPSPA